jgi:hypothetical protein
LLCPGGLGIGIAAGPQHGQEDLCLPGLPGGRSYDQKLCMR